MQFNDTVSLDGVRFSKDGYLVADANIARTGLQTYLGSELGRPDMDKVRVFRPESAVFDEKSMSTFAWRPVTVDHPKDMVDASNWKQLSVGTTGDTVVRNGDYIRVPLTIMDSAAIESIKAGRRELSAGYTAEIVWGDGVTPDGEHFDAQVQSISANHLAVVAKARAGSACRLGDDDVPTPTTDPSTGGQNMADTIPLKAVMLDGLEIQTTTQGAQAIERLQRQLSDATALVTARDAAVAAAQAEVAKVIEAKDAEVAAAKDSVKSAVETVEGKMAALVSDHAAALAARDGEVAALRDSIPDATKLDGLIAARAAVIDAARKILGDAFDPKGKSDADIRRAAVVKRLGDAMVSGKSDEFVGAAFETLSAVTAPPAGRDPVRDALRTAQPVADAAGSQSAHDAYVENLRNAWKGESQKGAA